MAVGFAKNLESKEGLKKDGVISGKVIEAKKQIPIEYANIVLLSKVDGKMITGTVSDRNGDFTIKNIPNGNYEVKISFMGFKNKLIKNVEFTDEKVSFKLNEIALEIEDVVLQTATVVGEKSEVEFKLDKKIINVSQNINATGGSVIDVLQNQPSIQVDANGNVTLRGSGNFQVLMDGKPTPIQGSDALKQIPANIVDNVEIITNPNAKYDAEGTSGIINIVSKKLSEDQFNGLANGTIGSRNKYGGDFTFNYRNPNFNLSGGLDARRNQNTQTIQLDRDTYFNNTDINNYNSAHLLFRRDNFNFRYGFDYYLTPKNTVTINGSVGKVDIFKNVFNDKVYSDRKLAYEKRSTTDDNEDMNIKYYNASVYLNHVFEPKISELTLESSITNVKQPTLQYVTDNAPTTTNPVKREIDNGIERTDGRIKLNYYNKFNENSKIEAGIHTSLFSKDLDLRNSYYNYSTNKWDLSVNTSNKYDFKNNIFAGFVTYENIIAGINYQLGLRYEYNDRLLEQKTTQEKVEYNKGDFFPSLNLSTQISEGQTIQFSYSRRITRPFDQALNPFESYSDEYTIIKGNPKLVPSFTNSIELNWQKFIPGVFMSVQTYFREQTNAIEQVPNVRPDGKLIMTFDNVATNRNIGVEISSNLTLAQWLRIDPVINLFHATVKGESEYFSADFKQFTYSGRLQATLSFSPVTRLMLFTNYNSKQVTASGTLQPFTIIGATVRQEFFERALAVTLSAQNLFGTMKFDIESRSNNYITRFLATPENPVFNLTLTYNFNNYKRTARGPERVDINVNEGL